MPDKPKKYKIVISKDALWDIKSTKKYILDTFKYREYAENFSKKIKKAIKELDSFPKGYEATGYVIEGLSVYFKPYSTYGEALRITQDHLDSKNFYAFNPAFDRCKDCDNKPDCGCNN